MNKVKSMTVHHTRGGVWVPVINMVLAMRDYDPGPMVYEGYAHSLTLKAKKARDEYEAAHPRSNGFSVAKKILDKGKQWRAPSVEEWHIILYYLDEINACLEEHGGEPLRLLWYHTSTCGKYSQEHWAVNCYSGYVGPTHEHRAKCLFRLIKSAEKEEKA